MKAEIKITLDYPGDTPDDSYRRLRIKNAIKKALRFHLLEEEDRDYDLYRVEVNLTPGS